MFILMYLSPKKILFDLQCYFQCIYFENPVCLCSFSRHLIWKTYFYQGTIFNSSNGTTNGPVVLDAGQKEMLDIIIYINIMQFPQFYLTLLILSMDTNVFLSLFHHLYLFSLTGIIKATENQQISQLELSQN